MPTFLFTDIRVKIRHSEAYDCTYKECEKCYKIKNKINFHNNVFLKKKPSKCAS